MAEGDEMTMDYPDDTDGAELRKVAAAGADMSSPMVIEFSIEAADERSARNIAELVEAQGFDPSISDNEGRGTWSVYCARSMLATYDGVVAVQTELTALVAAHGGRCDGWATFGNEALSNQ